MRPTTLTKMLTGNATVDRVLELWRSILAPIIKEHLVSIVTAPASASSPGAPGQIAIDSGFVYVCTDTNTWTRAALSTW